MKDLGAAMAFLSALDRPAHRALLAADPLLVALVDESMARQTRYRRLQDAHGSVVCGRCPHGGCCRREFVRVLDVLPRLAVGLALAPAINPSSACCSFLGQRGCTMVPAPLPNICTAFHCRTLLEADPTGFGEQLSQLAQHAEDLSRVLVGYLTHTYALRDADAEIDLYAPAVSIAPVAALPLRLVKRPIPALRLKSVPHPSATIFAELGIELPSQLRVVR